MVDFDMVLDAVKVEPNKYSREETLEHLRPYIQPLLTYALKDILHPEAIEALKKRLKPGMEEYLEEINLKELLPGYSMNASDGSRLHRKRAPRINYRHAAELLIQFLMDNPRSSFRDIKEHLYTHGEGITQSQWQRLRQLLFSEPIEYNGKKYRLVHEGEKSKTRWWVEEVSE